jgi:CRP/FNR family transcriptional regulator, cyclic AMP receptor protein
MVQGQSKHQGRAGSPPAFMPLGARRALVKAAVRVELHAKEILFHAGDEGDGCYLIRSGAVKASVVSVDGQERLLAVLGKGALIGELALLDDESRSATVTALRQCRLLHLTKSAFFRLADANPLIYRMALRLLAQRLRGSNESIVAQGSVTVQGRVARAFASLAEGLGEAQADGRILLAQRVTQSDIAGMAGVARENASRAINDLLRGGILGRVRGFYSIDKPEKLRGLAQI